jgi:hypothetical protein
MPKVSVTGTPPPGASDGDKPADSASGTDAGGSGSSGGTDTGGGASAAGTGGTGGDTAKQQNDGKGKDAKAKGPPAPGKVKITFTQGAGDPIPVNGDTYRKMYEEVDSNAQLKKEGGRVKPEAGAPGTIVWAAGVHADTPKDEQYFKEVPITITLKVSLPQWTGKGSVSADDDKKWKKWADGVKAHEDKHIAAFKKVKEVTVDSAKQDDIDTAVADAWTKNNADQQTVDASPPPPLDAPGGTTKIGPDGKETPASTDGKEASAAGEEHKPAEGDTGGSSNGGTGSSPTPPSGGGSNQPSAQA